MVEPDANVLAGYGLDTNTIVNKIKAENVDAPAGILAIGPKEFVIRANSLYKGADQVANTVLTVKNGAPVYIRDVAKVTDGIQEIRSFSRLDGVPSIALAITAQPDANVIAVSQGVYAQDRRLPEALSHDALRRRVRPAGLHPPTRSTRSMHTAIYGAILAVLIILLFLHSLRSTLIVAISLPISVMGTLFAAYMLNQSLNIMTLGGLALAVGLIVDDAVVVIENIYRHLAMGESPREAARNATSQIFSAVLASTITVVTVFVPLLLIPGLQGLIFGPFALVIIVGVAISLLVATTTVPMLSSIMLDAHTVARGAKARRAGGSTRTSVSAPAFDRAYTRFEGAYRRLLGAAIDRPGAGAEHRRRSARARRRRRQSGRREDRDVPRFVIALRAGERAHAERHVGREHQRRLAEGRGGFAPRSARRRRLGDGRLGVRRRRQPRRHQSGVAWPSRSSPASTVPRPTTSSTSGRSGSAARHAAARPAAAPAARRAATTRTSRRSSARSSANCAAR